jgi:hypothetical protein
VEHFEAAIGAARSVRHPTKRLVWCCYNTIHVLFNIWCHFYAARKKCRRTKETSQSKLIVHTPPFSMDETTNAALLTLAGCVNMIHSAIVNAIMYAKP